MRIALVYFNVKRLIICVHNDKFLFIISKLDYIVNNSGFDILTYNLGFHSGKDHNLNMSLSMSLSFILIVNYLALRLNAINHDKNYEIYKGIL